MFSGSFAGVRTAYQIKAVDMITRPADYDLVRVGVTDLTSGNMSGISLRHDTLASRSKLSDASSGLAKCVFVQVGQMSSRESR